MKYALSVLVVLLVPVLAYSQAKEAPRPQITTAQIHNADIIGSLGVPLGACVPIEATITSGGLNKADQGRYFLTVTHVADRQLAQPVRCSFHVHRSATSRVKLANGSFDLHELRTGKKTGQLDSDQIAELERGYVGSRVLLTVYETGGFDGMPRNLPRDVAVWADREFGFATYLVVMDQAGTE